MIRFLWGIRFSRRSGSQFQRSNLGVMQRVGTSGSHFLGFVPTHLVDSGREKEKKIHTGKERFRELLVFLCESWNIGTLALAAPSRKTERARSLLFRQKFFYSVDGTHSAVCLTLSHTHTHTYTHTHTHTLWYTPVCDWLLVNRVYCIANFNNNNIKYNDTRQLRPSSSKCTYSCKLWLIQLPCLPNCPSFGRWAIGQARQLDHS